MMVLPYDLFTTPRQLSFWKNPVLHCKQSQGFPCRQTLFRPIDVTLNNNGSLCCLASVHQQNRLTHQSPPRGAHIPCDTPPSSQSCFRCLRSLRTRSANTRRRMHQMPTSLCSCCMVRVHVADHTQLRTIKYWN